MNECIIVTGANGQIGTELVEKLRALHGSEAVLALDIRPPAKPAACGLFLQSDIMDRESLRQIFTAHRPTQVYHLAAILSAVGEANPKKAWELNMEGLMNVLDYCVEFKVSKVFWPSSIAVFGPSTPKVLSPQQTVMDPSTVYGISKLAGERWCEYYYNQFGLDIRSIRYPGIISWKTLPGGGTTDYSIHMYRHALESQHYECYLSSDSMLPMIYMDDAIRATLEIMEAPAVSVKVRSSYNLAGLSYTPAEQASAIQKLIPEFRTSYLQEDLRQKIADSWPASIDDSAACADWGWKAEFNLERMTAEMLVHLQANPELLNI